MLGTRYSGRYPVIRLYRIGKMDAAALLAQGWNLRPSMSGRAYEVIDPAGFARYWLAGNAGAALLADEAREREEA